MHRFYRSSNRNGGLVNLSRQKKILISLPDALLDEVDNLATKQKINRSEFIREAMRLYIKEKKRTELTARMKRGYEEMAEINLEISEYCLSADGMQQQSYEEKLAECE